MRRKSLIAAAVIVAGLAWMFLSLRDPNQQLYPPIRHADGTTEFRLINSGPDLIDGTSDDQHWVLRMPAGLWLHFPDEGRTAQQKKDNPDYPYNLSFTMIVLLPDFAFVQEPYEGSRKDNLRVRIDSPIVPYGSGRFEGGAGLAFSARHDLKANFNCRKDTEIGPGVFRLRDPNEDEIREMGDIYGTDPRRGPSRFFFPPRCTGESLQGHRLEQVAVYDAAGNPTGHGTCTHPLETDTNPDAYTSCVFWFWLPLERELQLSLSGEHVPQLQSIHTRLADLIWHATDHGKSTNLVAWEKVQ
ncbi:MAG TPA: hypothetical protein VJ906_10430 [Roseovarius sp.]|nr:hypothetical protein [Roseovarius sp.]